MGDPGLRSGRGWRGLEGLEKDAEKEMSNVIDVLGLCKSCICFLFCFFRSRHTVAVPLGKLVGLVGQFQEVSPQSLGIQSYLVNR